MTTVKLDQLYKLITQLVVISVKHPLTQRFSNFLDNEAQLSSKTLPEPYKKTLTVFCYNKINFVFLMEGIDSTHWRLNMQ